MKDMPLQSWVHIGVIAVTLIFTGFVGREVYLSYRHAWTTERGHYDYSRNNFAGAKQAADTLMGLEGNAAGRARELRAAAYLMAGEFDAAATDYEAIGDARPTGALGKQLVELYRLNQQRMATGVANNEVARLRAIRGAVAQAMSSPRDRGDSNVILDAQVLLGLIDLDLGEYESAKKQLSAVLRSCSGAPDIRVPSLPYCAAMYNGLGIALILAPGDRDDAMRRDEYAKALTCFRTAQHYHQAWIAPYVNEARVQFLNAALAIRPCAENATQENRTVVAGSIARLMLVDRRLREWLDIDLGARAPQMEPAMARLNGMFRAAEYEVQYWTNNWMYDTSRAIEHFNGVDRHLMGVHDVGVFQWNALCMMAATLKNSRRGDEIAAMMVSRIARLILPDGPLKCELPPALKAHAAAMAVACVENYPGSSGVRTATEALAVFIPMAIDGASPTSPPAPLDGYRLKLEFLAFAERERAVTATSVNEAMFLLDKFLNAPYLADPRASQFWVERLYRNYLIIGCLPAATGVPPVAPAHVVAQFKEAAAVIRDRYGIVSDIEAKTLGLGPK